MKFLSHVIFITEKHQENGASSQDDENSQQNDPTAERKFFSRNFELFTSSFQENLNIQCLRCMYSLDCFSQKRIHTILCLCFF